MRLFISALRPLLRKLTKQFSKSHRSPYSGYVYGYGDQYETRPNPYDDTTRGHGGQPRYRVSKPRFAISKPEETLPQGDIRRRRSARPNVFPGQLAIPEKTRAEICAKTLFITGRIWLIARSRLWQIVGRGKDLNHLGRYNIYPKESEQVLDDQARRC